VTTLPASGLLPLAWSLHMAGMTGRALALLETMLGAEPQVDALELKVLLLRRSGALAEAADACDALARVQPEHPYATYAADVLRGVAPPANVRRSAPWPGAFCLIEHFLDDARHGELLELVNDRADAFVPATVGIPTETGRRPGVDPDQRVSVRLADIEPIRSWFLPLVQSRLAEMIARCDTTPFTPNEIELKCSAYANGHFFKAHSDNFYHVTRRLSFVYYFHRTPKPYTGGDLLLYDTSVNDASRYDPDRFTRIETRDNSLLVFPSELFHEVTPVMSPSGAFADARFTLNGHIHACAKPPAIDEQL
jgi:hypothetical protein